VAVAREIARDALRLARELDDAKVDVVMAVGDEAIVAAKNATPTIPIVMVACGLARWHSKSVGQLRSWH
jgi:hypothetical protein